MAACRTPVNILPATRPKVAMNVSRLIACLLFLGTCQSSIQGAGLIADPQLEKTVREALKRQQIEKPQLDAADLKQLFFLDARDLGIVSLAGLEHATNLTEIKLNGNAIADLSPLSGLLNVQSLYLSENEISDIAPLSKLVKLQYLELNGNQISSVTGLQTLVNLRSLSLDRNAIADLAPLSSLTQLRSLSLASNRIRHLEPLARLPWISVLDLQENNILDLTPLKEYTELRYTFLQGNPIVHYEVLREMAERDAAGEKRFAPYWFLYVDIAAPSQAAVTDVIALEKLGVRVNVPPAPQ